MAKLYGISGKATGKKGDTVFSVRNGEQIMRQYNPVVRNPRTEAQTEARGKMKLMSQLSAIFGGVIAMQREGAKSPRNRFFAENYELIEFAGSEAKCRLVDLQLTKSAIAMTGFTASRNGSTSINVALEADSSELYDKVVYVLATIDANGNIRVMDSEVVATAGTGGTFAGQLAYSADSCVVLAYGMRANNAKASDAFANIEGNAASHIASVLTSRTISMQDVTLTETLGVEIAAL